MLKDQFAERKSKPCVDCGELFEVPVNMYRRAERCPVCREDRKRETSVAYHRLHRKPKADPVTKYRVLSTDWGFNSYLSMSEIRDLIARRYLSDGTTFQRRDGKTLRYNGTKLEEVKE